MLKISTSPSYIGVEAYHKTTKEALHMIGKVHILTCLLIFLIFPLTSKAQEAERQKGAANRCASTPTGTKAGFDPRDPAVSGYGLVFDEEFNDLTHVDFSSRPSQGYNFYTSNLVGCAPKGGKPRSIFSITNEGALRDGGFEAGCGYDIASAGFAKGHIGKLGPWSNNWVGQAFGYGAYFEARIKWKPKLDTGKKFAHVAWWADSVEAIFQNGALTLSQGFPHMNWVEVDFLENDGDKKNFSSSLLHWCDFPGCGLNAAFHAIGNDEGQKSGKSNFSNNQVSLAEGDSFDKYHVYGTLWLYGGPAGSGTTGHLINYLDGVPTKSQVYWTNNYRFDSPQNNPPKGYDIFSTLDQEHLAIILGTGPSAPIEVDWVHVWQLPKAALMSGNRFITPQENFSGGTGACSAEPLNAPTQ